MTQNDFRVYNLVFTSIGTMVCHVNVSKSPGDSIIFYTTCSSLHHEEMIKTHLLPVVAVEYSGCFKQVLTACEESVKYCSIVYLSVVTNYIKVIKVWDIDTGMKVFEFCNVHDESPITTIMLDDTGKKLVTGGQDGKIKIWNYNNGSCVRIMDKGIICSFF